LRTWLINCRVTEIVMESTGQYWRPVWNILEEAFPAMVLVNPLYVKALAGRKTDRLDAKWLANRLERDDLKGSFIPPRDIRELRDLTRLRVHSSRRRTRRLFSFGGCWPPSSRHVRCRSQH